MGLLAWKSCRQKRACRSTVGAEMLSLSDGVDAADWIRGLWAEIRGSADPRNALLSAPPNHWVVDCKDLYLYDSVRRDASGGTSTEKRLTLELIILKEFLARGFDSVHWIDTHQMLADSLTKTMPSDYLLARLSEARWCFKSAPAVVRKSKNKAKRSIEVVARLAPTVKPKAFLAKCPHCHADHFAPRHRFALILGREVDLHRPSRFHYCATCLQNFRTAVPTVGLKI